MQDEEWRQVERLARKHGMTLSEWARQALRKARLASAETNVEAKLNAIRTAAMLTDAPAPDIEQMLRETERGYLTEHPRG